MEVIKGDKCENCKETKDVIKFDYLGMAFTWLCKECLERALAMVKGEDNG